MESQVLYLFMFSDKEWANTAETDFSSLGENCEERQLPGELAVSAGSRESE